MFNRGCLGASPNPRAGHQCIRVRPVCRTKYQSAHRCRPSKACKTLMKFVGSPLASKIAPKIVYVFDTIADVSAILPHAVERKILDRARFRFEAVRAGK